MTREEGRNKGTGCDADRFLSRVQSGEEVERNGQDSRTSFLPRRTEEELRETWGSASGQRHIFNYVKLP